MTASRQRMLGKCVVLVGCLWFILVFFWLPPATLALAWLHLPEVFYSVLTRSEFVISAATAAVGVLVWLRASRELSVADYIIAFGGASIPVFAVFKLYIGH
jgi:hypothetical protein